MKKQLTMIILLFSLIPLALHTSTLLPPINLITSNPTDAGGKYWFQVGVSVPPMPVTGASVEIRVRSPQNVVEPDADLSYWIGEQLQSQAFIQVGYNFWHGNTPKWFYEYFPPGTTGSVEQEVATGFLGQEGDPVGPNGTWIKFGLASSGSTWTAYVNGQAVGSADLGASTSILGPYVIAEAASVTTTSNILGPVEFRNLQVRNQAFEWLPARTALKVCCGTPGPYVDKFPYTVVSIPYENNHWLAGSNLLSRPYQVTPGSKLWPWHKVSVQSNIGSTTGSGRYIEGQTFTPTTPLEKDVSANERYVFQGWLLQDTIQSSKQFTVNSDLSLNASYTHEYSVQVNTTIGQARIGNVDRNNAWVPQGTTVSITIAKDSDALFLGWAGDQTGSSKTFNVTVNSPKQFIARWITYMQLYQETSILSIALIAVTALIIQVRKKMKSSGEQTLQKY